MTSFSRFLTWVFTLSVVAILLTRAYMLFDNPTPNGLGRVQTFFGILPEKFIFKDCAVEAKNVMYAESIQYESNGRIWLFGLLPLKRVNKGVCGKMYVLKADDKREVTLNTLSEVERTGIEIGLESCVRGGICKNIPERDGFLVKAGAVNSLVIPQLGIRISTTEPEFPNWFSCTHAQP